MKEAKNNIVIQNLYKKKGRKEILKNISFEAKQGKITAFLGPNGAGKSSTLRILLGLDFPTKGTANFGSESYASMKYPLKTVGAVFDGIGGVFSRKMVTHLWIVAQSNQISFKRVEEVIKITGLSEKRNSKLGHLSLGEGQRLGLAAALLGDPQYLVLDEPTNGLDPIGMRWFRKFIKAQAEKGKTILISSHFLAEVEEIADEVVVIHEGQIKANGDIHSIKQNLKSLEEVFFYVMENEEGL